MARAPLRCNRLAHRPIISGRRWGGRCSTTCEQKMPSSEASGRFSRYTNKSATSASSALCRHVATDSGSRSMPLAGMPAACKGVERLVPARGHRFRVQVDALSGDAGGLHHFQEFAAAAPDIEHVAASAEVRQIDLLARLDIFLGAAEALREASVVESQRHVGQTIVLDRKSV